jgi:hypothetical protein
MNSKIVKAHCYSPEDQVYCVTGKVLRVFDTNGSGDLIPVSFQRDVEFKNQFSLESFAYGQIYAEISN